MAVVFRSIKTDHWTFKKMHWINKEVQRNFDIGIIHVTDGDLNASIDSEPINVLNEGQWTMSQMWVYMDGHITDRMATDSGGASESCGVCSSERARFLCPLRLDQVKILYRTSLPEQPSEAAFSSSDTSKHCLLY